MLEDLKKVFRPEFLNRLDETIVFTQLGREEIRAIARRLLEQVARRLEALGVELRYTDEAVDALARSGFDPDYGARPLRRAIRTQVEDIWRRAFAQRSADTGLRRPAPRAGRRAFPYPRACRAAGAQYQGNGDLTP